MNEPNLHTSPITTEFSKAIGIQTRNPELPEIIERLQREINHYEELANETHNTLLRIKKYDEPLDHSDAKEITPESALEELQYLLVRFNNLNNKARINLNHLKQII